MEKNKFWERSARALCLSVNNDVIPPERRKVLCNNATPTMRSPADANDGQGRELRLDI
jgi:hypothetical protein